MMIDFLEMQSKFMGRESKGVDVIVICSTL